MRVLVYRLNLTVLRLDRLILSLPPLPPLLRLIFALPPLEKEVKEGEGRRRPNTATAAEAEEWPCP